MRTAGREFSFRHYPHLMAFLAQELGYGEEPVLLWGIIRRHHDQHGICRQVVRHLLAAIDVGKHAAGNQREVIEPCLPQSSWRITDALSHSDTSHRSSSERRNKPYAE